MQSALFVFTVAWISDKGYMYFRNMVIQKKTFSEYEEKI